MSHARNIGRVQRWIPWLLLSRWKPRTVETHLLLKFGGGSDLKFKIELGKNVVWWGWDAPGEGAAHTASDSHANMVLQYTKIPLIQSRR